MSLGLLYILPILIYPQNFIYFKGHGSHTLINNIHSIPDQFKINYRYRVKSKKLSIHDPQSLRVHLVNHRYHLDIGAVLVFGVDCPGIVDSEY